MNPVFGVAHLTKTHHVGDVDVHALRDVSLQLPDGEFVVLEALARANAISAMADRVIRLADGGVTSVEERHGRKLAPKELSW
jgi:hypothetical protein